jgi:hypothetical protein
MDRIGQPDRAQEFRQMSVGEYAGYGGLRLANPSRHRRKIMARTTVRSKSELDEQIEDAIGILDDAYQPESTREELAEAVGKALDVLRAEEETEEDEADDQDELGD